MVTKWCAGVVALLALVGVAAAFRLMRASDDLHTAQALVDTASAALEEGQLVDSQRGLREAEALIIRANGALYGKPELDVLGWLPVAGDNLRSLRRSVAEAARIVNGGRRILEAASPLHGPDGRLEISLSDGTLQIDALVAAAREVTAMAAALPGPDEAGRGRFLLGPVRELRDRIEDEAIRRRGQLKVLDRGLSLLTDLAGGNGPRRYLIAVANSAEMRGSGGMILNYGVLEGRDGVIDLTAFGRIDELAVPVAVSSELVPADYLARWSGFDPLSRWRNANLAGDFAVVAPVLEAMYIAATGEPVDGVIQIDPVGLSALLDGVGPVQVPELGEVRGDNVVALTLNGAYVQFPGIDGRSDVLGDVAEAAFRRLVDGDVPSLRTLATRLVEAVDGRHLLVHSTSRRTQGALAALGADGAYPPVDTSESMALTVQNLAGNKLDYYLDTDLQLSGERPAGELGEIKAQVTLTNTAPSGVRDPQYIFGPGPTQTPLPAGVVRSLVTLYLPPGTSVDGVTGDATVEPVSSGTEAGRPYAAFTVDLPAGEARSVTLSLRLAPRPEGPFVLDVIPSPRVRPTTVQVDITTEGESVEGEVELDRRWQFTPGRDPNPVPGPAFR